MQPHRLAQLNLLRAAIFLFGVVFVATFYGLGFGKELNPASLQNHATRAAAFYKQSPATVIALYFFASILFISFFIPVGTVLKMVAGAIFGEWAGGLIAVVSNTSASFFAFLMARFLFAQWIRQSQWSVLRAVHKELDKDAPWYLISMRLAPGIPLPVLNVAMGVSTVKPSIFLLLSFVGVFPSSILFARIGANLVRLNTAPPEASFNILVSLALLAVMPLAWHKLNPRKSPRSGLS